MQYVHKKDWAGLLRNERLLHFLRSSCGACGCLYFNEPTLQEERDSASCRAALRDDPEQQELSLWLNTSKAPDTKMAFWVGTKRKTSFCRLERAMIF